MTHITELGFVVERVRSSEDLELRKWCVQQAVIATHDGSDLLERSAAIYNWVTSSERREPLGAAA